MSTDMPTVTRSSRMRVRDRSWHPIIFAIFRTTDDLMLQLVLMIYFLKM